MVDFSSKQEFLDKLFCPMCGGNLSCSVGVSCVECHENFMSDDGLLELLPRALRYGAQENETATNEYADQLFQRKHSDQWANADFSYEDFAHSPIIHGIKNYCDPYFAERIESGNWLLDIGCGEGDFSVKASQAGVHVIAFDISRELVLQAIKKAQNAGVSERVLFFVGDGGNISAKDSAFDCATTMGALHHMPNAKKTCTDINRLLRPGGQYLFSENNCSALRPIFDLMMKIYPLWHEEAGEMPLISELNLKKFLANFSFDIRYSVYVPPHLVDMLGMRYGAFLVAATNRMFEKIPAVRRLGGIIYGAAQKKK